MMLSVSSCSSSYYYLAATGAETATVGVIAGAGY